MADIVDPDTRSRMMSGIRGKDTRPEMLVRKELHARGFRFRLHDRRLPGRPDLVLPRYRTVIFVHGCFWHRHEGCSYATTPATRPKFWQEKFTANKKRDRQARKDLAALGWRVFVVWECGLKHCPEKTIDTLARALVAGEGGNREFPATPPRPATRVPPRS